VIYLSRAGVIQYNEPLLQLCWRHIEQTALGAHNPTEPDANSPSNHPTTLTSLKKAVPLHAHACEALSEFEEPIRWGQM